MERDSWGGPLGKERRVMRRNRVRLPPGLLLKTRHSETTSRNETTEALSCCEIWEAQAAERNKMKQREEQNKDLATTTRPFHPFIQSWSRAGVEKKAEPGLHQRNLHSAHAGQRMRPCHAQGTGLQRRGCNSSVQCGFACSSRSRGMRAALRAQSKEPLFDGCVHILSSRAQH